MVLGSNPSGHTDNQALRKVKLLGAFLLHTICILIFLFLSAVINRLKQAYINQRLFFTVKAILSLLKEFKKEWAHLMKGAPSVEI